MIGRRFESGFGDSIGRSRSACGSQTPTRFLSGPFSWGCGSERPRSVRCGRRVPTVFVAMPRFVCRQEPHTKGTEHFPLELRAKTFGFPVGAG